MDRTGSKTSAWVETSYTLGTAHLKLYTYDGVGRLMAVSTLTIPHRGLAQLMRKIDLHDADLEQDALPF